ncbi:hypothetical protein M0Q97_10845 [Candidatus Dojkabacteria bacterium]|jgi:hypothetical protein|nr:hypothetical protein [Candidatus Dojkabacteria bacterium]
MKYIKKYNFIIERTDLEKREEITILLNNIIDIIKNHYAAIIDKILNGTIKPNDYINDDMELYSSALEIPLKSFKFIIKIKKSDKKNKYGGSYEKIKGKYYLTLLLNELFDIIENVFFMNEKILPKLKNDLLSYNLDDEEYSIMFHELIHAKDDMKYDVFDSLRQACKKSNLPKIYNTGLNNIPNYDSKKDPIFMAEYDKVYSNLNVEYNGYFLTSVDRLLRKLNDKQIKWEQISDFDTFKDFFILLSDRFYNFYYKTEKYKKYYDKRMYDLYSKLKNKYEK